MRSTTLENLPARWSVPPQPVWLTVFKLLGVAASTVLLAWVASQVALAWLGRGSLADPATWLALPAFLVGYLLADWMSGTAHWFCDTFFDEDTPLIGQVLIQPFRDHHVHPHRITRYRFLEQDTSNFFLLLPALAVAAWHGAPRPGSALELLACCALVGLAVGSFCTNLFHKWAHQRRPPRLARLLQRSGLILSPERHSHHHRDHSRGFCVTSGWMNPALDKLGFFPRLERAVRFFQRG